MTPAPGHLTRLDASGSTADQCTNGVLQFQFWIDANNNGVIEPEPTDTLIRDWTDNPVYDTAPMADTNYAVNVRCSSAPDCTSAGDAKEAFQLIEVECPSTGNAGFGQDIFANTKTQYIWNVAATVDVLRGNLVGVGSNVGSSALRPTGNYTDTVETCLQDDATISSFTDGTSPLAAGDGLYYLVRGSGESQFCNVFNTYNSGGPAQVGDRDPEIAADANRCLP
jgi:hypothetical protein